MNKLDHGGVGASLGRHLQVLSVDLLHTLARRKQAGCDNPVVLFPRPVPHLNDIYRFTPLP
jgi:hypothetical protein